MKAIIYQEYGSPDVLKIQEIEKPVPKDDEILIKNYATTVNYGDLAGRNFGNLKTSEFNMPLLFWLIGKIDFGFKRPKRHLLGSEFAGEVESVGSNVKSFKPGDKVFGYLGQKMGGYAEYLTVKENSCATIIPGNLDFQEAAVLPYGSIMALSLSRKMNLDKTKKILIIGASGSIGSAAVQITKHFGAEVTGVCGTPRVEFVKSLGADKVIDYKKEDFAKNSETYDVIFDVLGKSSFGKCKSLLKDNGIYFRASFKSAQLLQMIWTKITGGKRVVCSIAPGSRDDLLAVTKFIEEGKIKAKIDKVFPAEQAAEAHRYVENGEKKGNVVINFN